MEWLNRLLNKSEYSEMHSDHAIKLAHDVWEAHRDWKVAELKLNEAVDPDQIDYAIYITEAAEKRLNMLLREAREHHLDLSDYGYHPPIARKSTLDT